MEYWPYDLVTPTTDRWWLRGVTINGGITTAGTAPAIRTDGGGVWCGEQTFTVWGRDEVKALRALEAALDSGIGHIVAWSYEFPFAPGNLTVGVVGHEEGSPFGDGTPYASAPAGATIAADAALRATILTLVMISGELQGGEHFSIDHPVRGKRRYRVRAVDGDQVEIRPPLREAVVEGDELNFLRVGCRCRLANPEEFMGALDAQTGGDVLEARALWIEAF